MKYWTIVCITFFVWPLSFSYGQETLAQTDHKVTCHSQLDTLTNLIVFDNLDKQPTVEGGLQSLYRTIGENVHFPSQDKFDLDPKMFVAFIVDVDGVVKGKRILRNKKRTQVAEDVLGIIENKKWIPGTCQGKAVATLVVFHLIVCLK
jgi:hypothetical protein